MTTVTVLADNTVAASRPRDLRGEWGFSAVIDDVLFDTGKSETAIHNARLLGLPTTYESIVLSHTHFDHTAGLDHFLDTQEKPTVYLHPDLWDARYRTTSPDGSTLSDPEYVAIPFSKESVRGGADLVEHRDPVEVASGIVALGEIPRPHAATAVGKIESDGELVDDPVIDDQSIAVRTEEGIAVVLGCGHAGLRNTIEYAETVTGDEVHAVIGGTHLVAVDDETIHDLADWLEGKLDLFAGCHCTGFAAQDILAERLPAAFRSVGVGSTIDL